MSFIEFAVRALSTELNSTLMNLYNMSVRLFFMQGPALYAYNNSQFTRADWKGIRLVCDSIKVEDPTKVGRFGLGFKSVFHMTGKAKYHVHIQNDIYTQAFWLTIIIYGGQKHPP